jgi:hypothetical protein
MAAVGSSFTVMETSVAAASPPPSNNHRYLHSRGLPAEDITIHAGGGLQRLQPRHVSPVASCHNSVHYDASTSSVELGIIQADSEAFSISRDSARHSSHLDAKSVSSAIGALVELTAGPSGLRSEYTLSGVDLPSEISCCSSCASRPRGLSFADSEPASPPQRKVWTTEQAASVSKVDATRNNVDTPPPDLRRVVYKEGYAGHQARAARVQPSCRAMQESSPALASMWSPRTPLGESRLYSPATTVSAGMATNLHWAGPRPKQQPQRAAQSATRRAAQMSVM